jgi:hypothetical protein
MNKETIFYSIMY